MDPIWSCVNNIYTPNLSNIICSYYYPKFLCSYTAGKAGIMFYKKSEHIKKCYFLLGLCDGGYLEQALEMYNDNSMFRDIILKFYYYKKDIVDSFIEENILYINAEDVVKSGAINIYRYIKGNIYDCVLKHGTERMLKNKKHTIDEFYMSLENINNIAPIVYELLEDKKIDHDKVIYHSIISSNSNVITFAVEKLGVNYRYAVHGNLFINKASLEFIQTLVKYGVMNAIHIKSAYRTNDYMRHVGKKESYYHPFEIERSVGGINSGVFSVCGNFDVVISCNIYHGYNEEKLNTAIYDIAKSSNLDARYIDNDISLYYMINIIEKFNMNTLNEELFYNNLGYTNMYLFHNINNFLNSTIYYPYLDTYKNVFADIKRLYERNNLLCCDRDVFYRTNVLLNSALKHIKIQNIGVDANTEDEFVVPNNLSYYNINYLYYSINKQLLSIGLRNCINDVKKISICNTGDKLDNQMVKFENILISQKSW